MTRCVRVHVSGEALVMDESHFCAVVLLHGSWVCQSVYCLAVTTLMSQN